MKKRTAPWYIAKRWPWGWILVRRGPRGILSPASRRTYPTWREAMDAAIAADRKVSS